MGENAGSIAISALSGAAFDTVEQMNAAYIVAESVIEKAMKALIEDAVSKVVEAVDRETWNMALAEKVGEEVRSALSKAQTPPHSGKE